MNKLQLVGCLAIGMSLISADRIWANETIQQIERYNSNQALDQVSNVSQLRDVSPGDWAFEALRNLVERYGCIAGYPNGTYRGSQAITRYEFAAGLNACLQQIERLIQAGSRGLSAGDLESLERLTQEFAAELATIGAKVDDLEGRVAFLEDNQFSTTTNLTGQVVFALASVVAGDDISGREVDRVPVLGQQTRLELNTSFSGEDSLYLRLSSGNFPEFAEVTGTAAGELGFAAPEDNNVGLEIALYSFPIGDRAEVLISGLGGAADDIADTLNFLDGDGLSGAISAFGTRNSIYFPMEDVGVGFNYSISDSLQLSLGYLANPANDPGSDSGLFNGAYSALAQLTFSPSDRLSIGLTYINSYNQSDFGTGSNLANFQSFTENLGIFGGAIPTSSNSYGVELSWQLSDRFVIGGWAGYTNTVPLSSGGGLLDRGSLDIWNWAVTLALPDLGKEGNVAGLIVGMEPFVTDSSVKLVGASDNLEDDDTSLHIEAFYEYRVNDNIAITPGVVWVTNPNNDENNDDLVIGTIRTTFSF